MIGEAADTVFLDPLSHSLTMSAMHNIDPPFHKVTISYHKLPYPSISARKFFKKVLDILPIL